MVVFISGCGDFEWFPNPRDRNGQTPSTTVPVLTMTFNPASVSAGANSTLTYTIINATGNPVQSGLGFTALLNTDLTVVSVPFNQCGGQAVKSGSKIIFNGGSLAAGTSSCTVTAMVTGTTPGSFTNKASDITGLIGGLTNGATDKTLTITAVQTSSPSLSIAFAPSSVPAGTQSTLTFTINNIAGNPAQSGFGFTDQLNSALIVDFVDPGTCGGQGNITSNGSKITFSGGSLNAGTASCTISATVTSMIPGSYTNMASDFSGLTGGLTNGVSNQTLAVTTPVVAVTIASVTHDPFDPGAIIVTFNATLNATNSSTSAKNIDIWFVARDAQGYDLLSTLNYVPASVDSGVSQFTVLLDADQSEVSQIDKWYITSVTVVP